MANLEKIKAIKDQRKGQNARDVLFLNSQVDYFSRYGCTIQEVKDLAHEYEDIIEYLVERLVHCDSERFS